MMCSPVEAETQLLSSGLSQFETIWDRKVATFSLLDQDYIEQINEVQTYLEKVKKFVRPGCSEEVLNVAVNSMSSLVQILCDISSSKKPHSSL